MTPRESKETTEALLNVIVGGVRPIGLVEDKVFIAFVKKLAPGYSVPSRKTITRKLEDKFSLCKAALGKLSNNVKFAAITADLWTSVCMQSFLGVTIHFINEEFELKNLVLATKETSGAHTGENIAKWLEEVMDDYEISPSKIVAIVTHNAANMVKACSMLKDKHGWHHVRCAAHTLQLCIKPALDSEGIKPALSKIRFLLLYTISIP